MQKPKHLIIGSGAAGLSALKQMRKLGSEDEVKIITMEDYPPYSPMSLPYLISGRRKEADIYITDNDYFDTMKSTFVKRKRVKRIHPHNNSVIYENGEKEFYDTLLIATGSEPFIQPILKEAGVPGFHIMDDYVRLKDIKNKSITILGAGFVGMELAVSLAEKGHRVRVIAPRERILRLYFDPEVDNLIIDLFRDHGIEINLCWGEVTEIKKVNGRFEAVLAQGHTIQTDLLIAATGVRPRVSFLNGSGININKGVIVDRMMKTNISNVFAAGDVAEAPSLLTGESGLSLIWPSAIEQGKIAGSNMVGEQAVYDGWLSMNTFNFFGHVALSIGEFMPSEGDEVLVEKDAHERKYVKILFRNNRLIGANFFNVDVQGGAFQYLIRNMVEIGPHKELLLKKPKEASLWLTAQSETTSTLSLER